eukprot:CAMPEP_0178378252 /NCGR_PEP_ID=MMETSP0689_2-20121128/4333_1 /TAXON_ID=160604 /ORGANISM="Amphidinium massartii, Strain CS-259" /LENGTH=452 /DNA_ID=CAMNT_0019998321 /DNA_START=6 /DNA_END=1360 /DNA_ORIENTATION=+
MAKLAPSVDDGVFLSRHQARHPGAGCAAEEFLQATAPDTQWLHRRLRRREPFLTSAFLFSEAGSGGSSSSTLPLPQQGHKLCLSEGSSTAFAGSSSGTLPLPQQAHKRRLNATATAFPGVAAGAGVATVAGGKVAEEVGETTGQYEYEMDKKNNNYQLLFVTNTGKEVLLDHRSKGGCLRSCNHAPELNEYTVEDAAIPKKAQAEITDSSPDNDLAACETFCDQQFRWGVFCFPEEATVIARSKGCVPMSSLSIGDEVLVARHPGACAATQVDFETVVSFLHRAPCATVEMLSIRHSLGTLRLSREHMVFVRRGCCCDEGQSDMELQRQQPPSAIRASEVTVGDEVLALWLDGTMVFSAVQEITSGRHKGAYAPLVAGGSLLVDGTLASCYALPAQVYQSALSRLLVRQFGDRMLQTVVHSLFWPVRFAFLCHGRAWPSSRRKQLNGARSES